jgi:type IV secretion system protein VirD4
MMQSLLVIIPPVVSAAIYTAASAGWPLLATQISGTGRYWFLRSLPLIVLMAGPLAGLVTVALLPLHRRQPIAIATLLTLFIVIAGYSWREYERLLPFVSTPGQSWNSVSRYLDMFVVTGATIGFGLAAVCARLALPGRDGFRRAKSAVFGDANWMPMRTAAKLFPSDGEIVVGERYRVDQTRVKEIPFDPADRTTWGDGGLTPLLTYKLNFDSTHMMFFAGSGGFKTTSAVVPTALRYSGPIVCLDPAGEVAPIVVGHRLRQGRRTYVLDPRHPEIGFNVLDWIASSPSKESDIVALAHMLLSESVRVESSTGSYFQNQAHNLLTGLLAHVMLSPEYEGQRNLRSLRQIVSRPEPAVLELLRSVQQNSASLFIRETLGVFTNMAEQTFSGVYSTASKDTQWLSLENYAALCCGNSFRSSDLARGDIDVFLNIPAAMLRSYPGIGRMIVGSLVNAMMQADGAHKRRALFILDEVDLLGYMRPLEDARDRGRKYGVTLMLMYQSVGQLEKHFGRDGATSWYEGCAFVSYAAIKTMDTAKDLSAKCGDMSVYVVGTSQNVGLIGSGVLK